LSITPSGTDIDLNISIKVSFDKAIDISTIWFNKVDTDCNQGSVQFSKNDFTDCLPIRTVNSNDDHNEFTIYPLNLLEASTSYKLKITTDVWSLAKNRLLRMYIGNNRSIKPSFINKDYFGHVQLLEEYISPSFTTVSSEPKVINISVYGSSENLFNTPIEPVSISGISITIQFNKPINLDTITTTSDTTCVGNIQLVKEGSSECVTLNVQSENNSNDSISLQLTGSLEYETNYQLIIEESIKDPAGNNLYTKYDHSFITGSEPPIVKFLDGGNQNGINADSNQNASQPKITYHASTLYAAWVEENGTASQIRVVQIKEGASTSITFIGDGSSNDSGINYDDTKNSTDPQLISYQNKLVVIWSEENGTAVKQIRVKICDTHNDNIWQFIDGNGLNGINEDNSYSASFAYPVIHNSKLYLAWQENNGTADQIRVKSYDALTGSGWPTDGSGWADVDGGTGTEGINKVVSSNSSKPSLTIYQSDLYIAWQEENGSSISQIRIAKYNNNDSTPAWTFVDGDGADGINKNPDYNATNTHLTFHDGNLYIAWQENNGAKDQVRLAQYNQGGSPLWTMIDGDHVSNGINKNNDQNAGNPLIESIDGQLYAVWSEELSSINQIRMALFDGLSSWALIDDDVTGWNLDATKNASNVFLESSNFGFYGVWTEENNSSKTQVRLIKRKVGQ